MNLTFLQNKKIDGKPKHQQMFKGTKEMQGIG